MIITNIHIIPHATHDNEQFPISYQGSPKVSIYTGQETRQNFQPAQIADLFVYPIQEIVISQKLAIPA